MNFYILSSGRKIWFNHVPLSQFRMTPQASWIVWMLAKKTWGANSCLILWDKSSEWFVKLKVSWPGLGVKFIRKPEVQRFYIVPTFIFEARMALRQMFHLIFSSISLLQTLRHTVNRYIHPGVSRRAHKWAIIGSWMEADNCAQSLKGI